MLSSCVIAALAVVHPKLADGEPLSNLLPNPGFESLAKDGSPAGWSSGFFRGEGTIKVVTGKSHSGQRSLMMAGLGNAAGQCFVSKPIPVKAGHRYQVDAWVNSTTGKAQIQIRWPNKGKGAPEQYSINMFRLDPGRWYQLSKLKPENWNAYHRLGKKLKLAKLKPDQFLFGDATEVRFYVFCSANATVYYDDLVLQSVGEDKPATAIDEDARAEYKRLLIEKDGHNFNRPIPDKPVVIESPDWDTIQELPSEFPDHGVSIRDGCFFRNGRHKFFIGMESSFPRPGIMELLGVKVHAMTGTSTYDNNWTVTKDEGDRISVSYREWVPLAPKVRDSIRYGFLPIVQTINHARAALIGRYGRPDLVVDQGHFIAYCPDQPIPRKLRENFWRSILARCRPYPILGYEHFNELGYMCYCRPSRDRFKALMKKKYETIERANSAWGTTFESFEEADPPYRKGSNTAEHIVPTGFSRPMWADWVRFTEEHFGRAMSDLMAASRKWDPSPNHLRGIQSHHLIRLDYVGVGVNPILKSRTEDFYGYEVGQGFFPQEPGNENANEIMASFVGLPLYGGVVRGITEHQPVVNLEGGIRQRGVKYNAEIMDRISLLPVQGEWNLKIDPEKRGLKERWHSPGYDDTDWQAVPINDVWDKHGHENYDGWGWYRKVIEVPPALKGKRLWFNGKGLDDSGTVYINGKEIGISRGWNRTFSFDISAALQYGKPNTFAIRIIDTTLYGGLRFYLGVNDFDVMRPNPVTRGMMRMYLWNHVIHGLDVSALSYFYSAESHPGSLFSPYKCSAESLKAIAETEVEINSVGDTVLPKPRIDGQLAIVYPLETFRAYVPENSKKWISYHATRDFLRYLVPLFCSDVDVDVLHTKHLIEGRAKNYRAIFLRQYERVPPGVLEALENYVRAGGVLVVDYSSLKVDDLWHKTVDAESLTGVKVTKMRKDEEKAGSFLTVPRHINSATGAQVELGKARPVMSFEDGNCAIARRRLGRGKVYFIAAEMSYDGISDFVERIVDETRAESEIVVRKPDGTRLRFCESHLFGRDGRYVAVIENYGGGDEEILVKLPVLPRGEYTIRSVDTRETLSFDGKTGFTGRALKRGFNAAIRSLDPLVLLIESVKLTPTPLPGLTPERSARLDAIWANRKDFHTRVLFEANYPRIDIPSTALLSARAMLNEAGYQWQMAISHYTKNGGLIKCFDGNRINERRLEEFGVLVIPSMQVWAHDFKPAEDAAVRRYVENGGGVLFLGRSFDRRGGFKALNQFGIKDTNDMIMDREHHIDGDPYYVTYTDLVEHPITDGVKAFQSRGGSHILPGKDSQAIIRASKSAVTRSGKVSEPVICIVKKVGKGRIAVVGDHRWTDPAFLKQGDNARLWMNLIDWLSGRNALEKDGD
ncbi:MAG: beta-galactosidase trimerization domain-containing protein [Planctomycetota bacterium]|nr:beta-galactosidase trimerization domain-containing protein [Planctomycetota bacterium]